jgi:ABC-type uncharacterized transport system ATPase subunit
MSMDVSQGSRALVVEGLTKTYPVFKRGASMREALASLVRRKQSTLTAVGDVGFTLEAGEMVGFLGPNGAGKSTTLKILSGILHPTSGRVEALGRFVPWKHRTQYVRHIGAVFGTCRPWTPSTCIAPSTTFRATVSTSAWASSSACWASRAS